MYLPFTSVVFLRLLTKTGRNNFFRVASIKKTIFSVKEAMLFDRKYKFFLIEASPKIF